MHNHLRYFGFTKNFKIPLSIDPCKCLQNHADRGGKSSSSFKWYEDCTLNLHITFPSMSVQKTSLCTGYNPHSRKHETTNFFIQLKK